MPVRNETATYTHNRLMSTDTAMYGYDNEGQLASKQEGATTAYTFDKAYRLTGIGANTQFSYDGAGNRLRAVRSGTETRYIYDAAGNLLAEADASNTITRYYVHGAGLLAAITPSDDLYCYHFDATGNTVAVTDGSQAVVNSYDYSPFGMILSESETFAQPFKYVGKLGVMAESNGFYYMRARYYDPVTGRFISEDPKGFDGGDVDLYVYAGNNPVLLVDPWGLYSAEQFLGDLATYSSVTATALLLVPGVDAIGVPVFAGIAAGSKVLQIGLYSEKPVRDSIQESAKMATPELFPASSLFTDQLIDLAYDTSDYLDNMIRGNNRCQH